MNVYSYNQINDITEAVAMQQLGHKSSQMKTAQQIARLRLQKPCLFTSSLLLPSKASSMNKAPKAMPIALSASPMQRFHKSSDFLAPVNTFFSSS